MPPEQPARLSPADLVRFALQLISSVVSDAVVVLEPERTILDVNAAFVDLLGLDGPPPTGTTLGSMLGSSEDSDRLIDLLEDPPSAVVDRPDSVEFDLVLRGGEQTTVAARAVRLGTLTVIVMQPLTVVSGGHTDERLAALETGVRNISWELQALGFDIRAPQRPSEAISADGLRNLSKREREVLDAFLDGKSVAASAALLHVSEHTVRSHLKAIYRKLGVRSQTELMLRMRENPPWG